MFYNVLSETCFARCIDNLNSRTVDEWEAQCVDKCSTKFINCNNRLIKIYAVLQEKIVTSRLKAIEEENLKLQTAGGIDQTVETIQSQHS